MKMAADMCFFFPVNTTLPTLNREPSSTINKNWKCSPVWGCMKCPMSAVTTSNRCGCGSKAATFLGCGLHFSAQTVNVNRSASLMISGWTPLFFKDWTKYRTGLWPVAACNRYKRRWISSLLMLHDPWSSAARPSPVSCSTGNLQEPHWRLMPWCLWSSQIQKVPFPKRSPSWWFPWNSSLICLGVCPWRITSQTLFANSLV